MRALVVLMVLVGVANAAPKSKSLVIVLDRSGSMQGPKLAAARRAVIAAAQALGPDGQLAVVAFDSEAYVYIRRQQVGDGKRIAAEVERLQSGGGTNVYPGLKEAYDILHELPGPRHVIVITDGQSPTDGLRELVYDMFDSGITVSAVALGPDADQQLVDLIADGGGGRAYDVHDFDTLAATVTDDVRASFGGVVASPHARRALVLMLDRSGSLSDAAFSAEKHAAIEAVHMLAPADQLAVIAFDSEAAVLVPLGPVGDGRRAVKQIDNLEHGGGTNVYAALVAARGLHASAPMQVLMLTDGEAAPDGVAEAALALDNLTVIGMQPKDRELLAEIAGHAGGLVYFVDDIGAVSATVRAWNAATSGVSSR
jgi:Mg-chelatase subunit ChlD